MRLSWYDCPIVIPSMIWLGVITSFLWWNWITMHHNQENFQVLEALLVRGPCMGSCMFSTRYLGDPRSIGKRHSTNMWWLKLERYCGTIFLAWEVAKCANLVNPQKWVFLDDKAPIKTYSVSLKALQQTSKTFQHVCVISNRRFWILGMTVPSTCLQAVRTSTKVVHLF